MRESAIARSSFVQHEDRMRFAYLLAAIALAFGCSRKDQPQGGQQQGTPQTVVVTKVTQRNVPIYGEFVGQSEAANTVEIRSQVSGFLQQIAFTEGAVVNKGQLLFVIDPRQYAAAVQQAKAALQQRQAALMKARNDVARYRPLVEQHAISREQLDTAIAQEAQERANVAAARAQLEQAQLNLGYTRISAAMTGRISAAQVKIGGLVQQGSTLLATLYSIDPMYVTFSVSEQRHLEYQRRIREHPQAPPALELILADGSTYPQKGKINMVSPQVNPSTGTVALRGQFPNPEGLLKPGLFVRIRVLIEERQNAIVVPQAAIQEVQGTRSVAVVGDDNKVAMRTIQTSATVDNSAVVESGLKPGERVVVEGLQKVRPGMLVNAQERPPQQEQARSGQQPQSQQPAAPASNAGRAPTPPAR
jgi:membrane fusion protein (multidrug efflux system)